MAATIYYDGDCPFCTRYVRLLRLRDTVGEVSLVDVRQHAADHERLQGLGFDLDKGMVVDWNGRLHGGSEAVHLLALLSTPSGAFNRLSRVLLGTRLGARLLYPLLRMGRGAALVYLDRAPIAAAALDDERARAQRTLFCMAWGLFAYLHAVIYAFDYGAPMYFTTWAMAPVGVALLLHPLSRRLFLLLLALMLVDAAFQMPTASNHTIITNTFLLGLLLSGAWHAVRGSAWRDFFADAAPIGRFALVCMYVFGVFHKLNSGFLDPSVSCAMVLWRAMPAPLSWIDFPAFGAAAIYGALVVETLILVCLLLPAGRRIGIVLGICFHALLALSTYAMYAPFSTLTIALHLLFLDADSARNIVASSTWQRLIARLHSKRGFLLLAIWMVAIALLAWDHRAGTIGLLWLPVVAALCYVVARFGRTPHAHGRNRLLWSRLWWLNGLSLLFFLGCVSPYLGLKTAQSINMFANLRLEGSVSNHLLLRHAPGPFHYLDDIVEIVEVENSGYLSSVRQRHLHLVYYALLDKLERNPSIRVTYRRHGALYRDQSAATLAADIATTLHPRWMRGVFHFNPVDLANPKPCAVDR